MDEHEPSCCPLPHLTHDQWTALCDATRVLKPLLRRRWPGFRSCIEDAVAEALTIVACKVKDGVMPFPDSFETLVDVLSQEATTFLKREKRHRCRESPSDLLPDDNWTDMPTYDVEPLLTVVLDVRDALSHLSPKLRSAVEVVYFHDQSVAEAAKCLGCTVATLKLRLFRARNKLRVLLADYEMKGGDGWHGGGGLLKTVKTAIVIKRSNLLSCGNLALHLSL